MITPKQLNDLVQKWGEPEYTPALRRPKCADCGHTLWFRMWHVFLKEFGNKREIHLCNRCYKKYE